ncbi:MAG: hypothetical protein IKL40_03770 [Clostridia bacterium]|nr:hypothetical protein [Clostridia bacterium]
MAEITTVKKQKRLFKYKRAGVVLTENEVREIKAGRKKLRRDMREAGIKSKKEFETTASTLGLYFDKNRKGMLLWLLFRGKLGWLLLGLAALLVASLFLFSYITQLKGHFTISMSGDMFREGFTISETEDFDNPTSHLFAKFAENVPCISIIDIPEDVDSIDGSHNGDYFAYTFYVRNEGESTQDLRWRLNINSESQNVSNAAWVMLFVDGKMTIYAEADEEGNKQCLPALDDNTCGYVEPPLEKLNADPKEQYEQIESKVPRWRIKPEKFDSPRLVDTQIITEIEPQEIHKITVVIWLEGDDPHCVNDLIGGHLGMEFYMEIPDDDE